MSGFVVSLLLHYIGNGGILWQEGNVWFCCQSIAALHRKWWYFMAGGKCLVLLSVYCCTTSEMVVFYNRREMSGFVVSLLLHYIGNGGIL